MEHHQSCVNITPPIMLETIIVETWKQHARVRITQPFGAGTTTTRVEIVVAPSINVVRKGMLIGYVAKLGSGSNRVSVVRNLNPSLALPTVTIRVIGMPQMVFTNPIMITHVNMIANQPLMSPMDGGGVEVKMSCIQKKDTNNQLL
jgi:hypothetical protein